jgi:post-segregation antitoxin (ccd killing protein)
MTSPPMPRPARPSTIHGTIFQTGLGRQEHACYISLTFVRKRSRPRKQEFVGTMYSTWEDARQLGEKQGRTAAQARDVLTVLWVRGIKVSNAARKRILAEQDAERLDRWLQRASVATSLDSVLDDRGSPPTRRVTASRSPRSPRSSNRRRA